MMKMDTDHPLCLENPFIQKSVISIRIKQEILNYIMRFFQNLTLERLING
jgi:hypothetical protein